MTSINSKHNDWDVTVVETEDGWYAVASHTQYGEIDTRDAMPKRDTAEAAELAIVSWADDIEADPALQ